MKVVKTFVQEEVRYFSCKDEGYNFECFKNDKGEWIFLGCLENFLLSDIDEDGTIKSALESFVRKEKLGKLLKK